MNSENDKPPMIHEMDCYRLVPSTEGLPGYVCESMYVVAYSMKEALEISAAQFPGYEVKGILLVGRARLNVLKLPEAKK